MSYSNSRIPKLDLGAILDSLFGLGEGSRKVSFRVGDRVVRASVPEDAIFFGMKDILYNREYELYPAFELQHPREVVVDAGANAGLYTVIASMFAKKVIALEPDLHSFRTLSENLSSNGIQNVVAIRSALWSDDGTVQFHKRRNSQLGSIKMHTESKEGESVEALSLNRLLEMITRHASRGIDLLKLDIEGAEFDVITSCNSRTLDAISRIVAEIHTEHGDYRDLAVKLKQGGFNYCILDRPARKTPDGNIRVISDFKVKLLMTLANLMMEVSHYHDQSSLLLYASREANDFVSLSHSGRSNVIDSHIR